jgi:hypothetical protein
LAYDPKPQHVQNGQSNIRNSVSQRVCSIEELKDEIKYIRSNKDGIYSLSNKQKKLLKNRIFNIDCLSVERIADLIDSINPCTTVKNTYNPSRKEQFKRMLSTVAGDKNITRIRETNLQSHWSHSNQKFSYVSNDRLRDRINTLSRYSDISSVKFERISILENTFLIYS